MLSLSDAVWGYLYFCQSISMIFQVSCSTYIYLHNTYASNSYLLKVYYVPGMVPGMSEQKDEGAVLRKYIV